MKVTHVAPISFGRSGLFGGGERYALELARSLARDIDCRLVTFGRESMTLREPSGLQLVVLETHRELRGNPAHPLARGLTAALRGADVVHTHHMRSAPSRLAALGARIQRQSLVTTDHGLGGGGWGGLLPRLFDLFLTVSRYSQSMLRVPDHRTRLIYGGADPRRFSPRRGVDRRGVLFVGRITPHKGIDGLIKALPKKAHLTIAGSTGHDPRFPERLYPQLLSRLAEGREIDFIGTVAEELLPDLYRSASVFVLPSVHDTCYRGHVAISELLGLTLIEAMACGTPVICSRVGGLPEVVHDGETGYIVEPGDVDGLRDRLEELLADPQRAQDMGHNGRELVMEEFTWQRCAQRCLAAYEELNGAA
jgi:glycosyltransferase involved in cell wall biosynthesis